MYHLEDLPFREGLRDMPDVFTPFKQKVGSLAPASVGFAMAGPVPCFQGQQLAHLCLAALGHTPAHASPASLVTVAATGVQCEDRCQVRKPFPAPAPGALPLPAGLEAARLAFEPQRVEDLNAVVPEGHPQLASPQRDTRVSRGTARVCAGMDRTGGTGRRSFRCCAVLCCAVLCCDMLCCAVLLIRRCSTLRAGRARRWPGCATTSSTPTWWPPTLTPATACWVRGLAGWAGGGAAPGQQAGGAAVR